MENEVLYEVTRSVARITINRPKQLNAFTNDTIAELVAAFTEAWRDPDVAAVILTGAGDRAFCAGGDQSARSESGYAGDVKRSDIGSDIEDLHSAIRDIPKPVIAAVNGYAIGGGHVLHVVCDLTIASENAVFGQAGPRVGSFDGGLGTGMLAATIGEKRAREMWYFCRRYSAQQALQMGLVNAVVPAADLLAEAQAWGEELALMSPTALRILKQSFNVGTEHLRAVSAIAMSALSMFYATDESLEGRAAFMERRPPRFRPGPDAPTPNEAAS